MKSAFILLLGVALEIHALAQSNPSSVRLAIINESSDTVATADLLTTELSKNDKVQLLERTEIEKVIQEQQLSLNNLDHLKLGRLLGADGLLALQAVTEGTNVFLNAQLVAVKPGVILTDERFGRPTQDTSSWLANIVGQLEPFLPKLGVLAQDAIPLSLVNFHAGVRTAETTDLERQIIFLATERLVREKRLFVLERKRMQALSEEKEMSATEAEPFWNGKYLLDGAIDQNGFNPDVVTINARLIPPGGTPVLIKVSGSRTNCIEAINQLVEKVLAALKLEANPAAWHPAEEADKFYKEAQWNLAWQIFPQARQSAEAAWALGKHDADCMKLRVQTFMPPPDSGVIYLPPREKPNPEKIDVAIQAARLFQEFSRNLPPEQPKPDSDWYNLGLDNLRIATRVLQQFNWSPEFYEPVADRLAELRVQARALAELLSRLPSVHDSYFVSSRRVKHDELHLPGIYELTLQGGCLWQEKPEDTLALYRRLMASPVFRYLHYYLWFRRDSSNHFLPQLPGRLVAWNKTDQKRLHDLWQRYVAELKESADVFLQVEGQALRLADTVEIGEAACYSDSIEARDAAWKKYDEELPIAYADFCNAFLTNRAYLKTNNVDVLYLNWGADDLIAGMGGNVITKTKESLQSQYRTEYAAKLAAIDKELEPIVTLLDNQQEFEDQKIFLKAKAPYDQQGFMRLVDWGFKDYSHEQAQEIRPLLAEYRKRLSGKWARVGQMEVERIQAAVDRILNIPPSQSLENLEVFAQQKKILQDKLPFDSQAFFFMFIAGFKAYSREQAQEIKPLLVEYKNQLSGNQARSHQRLVEQVETNLERILNPSAIARHSTNRVAMNHTNPAQSSGRNVSPSRPPLTGQSSTSPQPRPNHPAELLVSSNVITVRNFYPIPLDDLPGDNLAEFKFVDHQLVEGRVVLDFEFTAHFITTSTRIGNHEYIDNYSTNYAGAALFDPSLGHWQIAVLPVTAENAVWQMGAQPKLIHTTIGNRNPFLHHSTVWRGVLYSSNNGKVQKYDWQTGTWDAQALPVSGNCQLWNLAGRLYVADNNSIQQITDDARGTKLLASIQRLPPVTSLDSQGALMNLALFMDAKNFLCAAVHNKVFRWDENDWREIGVAPTTFPPSVFDNGALFMMDSSYTSPAQISRFNGINTNVELCLRQPDRHRVSAASTDLNENAKPIWKLPAELFLPNLSAAYWQSNLFLITEHSKKQNIMAEGQGTRSNATLDTAHIITDPQFASKDGYNASLFCFSQGLPAAQKIPLKFEAADGYPPTAGLPSYYSPQFAFTRAWILFTPKFLLCGREQLGDNISYSSEPAGFKPGIWVVPLDLIMPEVTSLKQTQAEAMLQQKLKADRLAEEARMKDEQTQQALLQKYDLNHNGVIEANEAGEALADERYVASKLNAIDSNHNDWLDAEELKYFDANGSKTLEPNEQASIEIAQHLLAERLLKKYDETGNGWLDRPVFNELLQASVTTGRRPTPNTFPDNNHDGHVDLGELETFFKQQTRAGLRAREMSGVAAFNQMRLNGNGNQPLDQRQLFKATVEAYWQSPEKDTNHKQDATGAGLAPN